MGFDPTALSGVGMDTLEEVNKMPLLRIIQDNSPEVKKSHKDYATRHIEGAEAGMILLSSTGDVMKEAVIVPLAQKTIYAEWRPKGEGGGFIGHHELTVVADPAYKKGDHKSPYNEFLGTNELIFTMYYFVLVLVGDEWKKAVIALKKTELKHGRALQDMIRRFSYPDDKKYEGVKPFMFSRTFTLSTEVDSNDEGSWFNWSIKPDRILDFDKDEDLLEIATEAHGDALAQLPKATPQKALATAGDENPF